MNPLHVALALVFTFPSQPYTGETQGQERSCRGVVHGVVLSQGGKPWGGIGLILEPVGDYDYILPRVKTDQQGEYRFEEVCDGRWGVFVEDKEAGYPYSGRNMNWFLYGVRSPQVEITDKNSDAQLNVNVPPKPGRLRVHVIARNTELKAANVKVQLKATRKRRILLSCGGADSSWCEGDYILVPPDQNLRLTITSIGFHEWRGSAERGKTIRVPSGEALTIDAELKRIQN